MSNQPQPVETPAPPAAFAVGRDQNLNLRLREHDVARLRKIAQELGAIAPSGYTQGQPSISRLLMMIADGEVLLSRRVPRTEPPARPRSFLGR